MESQLSWLRDWEIETQDMKLYKVCGCWSFLHKAQPVFGWSGHPSALSSLAGAVMVFYWLITTLKLNIWWVRPPVYWSRTAASQADISHSFFISVNKFGQRLYVVDRYGRSKTNKQIGQFNLKFLETDVKVMLQVTC